MTVFLELLIHAPATRGYMICMNYLDEFAFRYNRCKTKGVGRIAACVLENLVTNEPLFMRNLIKDTKPCRMFQPAQTAVT